MCKLCKIKPVYEFTNKRKVCKTCFIHWFEKKVLYTIRKFKMTSKGDLIGYKKEGDIRGVVLEEVMKMISKKGFIGIVKLSPRAHPTSQKETNKIAISSTIDSESEKIIHELIEGKSDNLEEVVPVDGKIIKPLYLFLDKEVLLYAKLKGLKFHKFSLTSPTKQAKQKKDKISEFIESLEKKHPEVKRAIVKGLLRVDII